jgi:hypothetical protein
MINLLYLNIAIYKNVDSTFSFEDMTEYIKHMKLYCYNTFVVNNLWILFCFNFCYKFLIETNVLNTNTNDILDKKYYTEHSLEMIKNSYDFSDPVTKQYNFIQKLRCTMICYNYFCRYVGIKWNDNNDTFQTPQKDN